MLIWTEFIVHREGGEGLDGWYRYFNQPGVSFNFIRVHENLEQHPSNYKSIIQVKRTLNLKSSKAFFPVFQSSGSLAMVKLASIPGTLSMNMKNLRSVLLVIVRIFLCYEYLLSPLTLSVCPFHDIFVLRSSLLKDIAILVSELFKWEREMD